LQLNLDEKLFVKLNSNKYFLFELESISFINSIK